MFFEYGDSNHQNDQNDQNDQNEFSNEDNSDEDYSDDDSISGSIVDKLTDNNPITDFIPPNIDKPPEQIKQIKQIKPRRTFQQLTDTFLSALFSPTRSTPHFEKFLLLVSLLVINTPFQGDDVHKKEYTKLCKLTTTPSIISSLILRHNYNKVTSSMCPDLAKELINSTIDSQFKSTKKSPPTDFPNRLNSKTILHFAFAIGAPASVILPLLRLGASPTVYDGFGWTPVRWGVERLLVGPHKTLAKFGLTPARCNLIPLSIRSSNITTSFRSTRIDAGYDVGFIRPKLATYNGKISNNGNTFQFLQDYDSRDDYLTFLDQFEALKYVGLLKYKDVGLTFAEKTKLLARECGLFAPKTTSDNYIPLADKEYTSALSAMYLLPLTTHEELSANIPLFLNFKQCHSYIGDAMNHPAYQPPSSLKLNNVNAKEQWILEKHHIPRRYGNLWAKPKTASNPIITTDYYSRLLSSVYECYRLVTKEFISKGGFRGKTIEQINLAKNELAAKIAKFGRISLPVPQISNRKAGLTIKDYKREINNCQSLLTGFLTGVGNIRDLIVQVRGICATHNKTDKKANKNGKKRDKSVKNKQIEPTITPFQQTLTQITNLLGKINKLVETGTIFNDIAKFTSSRSKFEPFLDEHDSNESKKDDKKDDKKNGKKNRKQKNNNDNKKDIKEEEKIKSFNIKDELNNLSNRVQSLIIHNGITFEDLKADPKNEFATFFGQKTKQYLEKFEHEKSLYQTTAPHNSKNTKHTKNTTKNNNSAPNSRKKLYQLFFSAPSKSFPNNSASRTYWLEPTIINDAIEESRASLVTFSGAVSPTAAIFPTPENPPPTQTNPTSITFLKLYNQLDSLPHVDLYSHFLACYVPIFQLQRESFNYSNYDAGSEQNTIKGLADLANRFSWFNTVLARHSLKLEMELWRYEENFRFLSTSLGEIKGGWEKAQRDEYNSLDNRIRAYLRNNQPTETEIVEIENYIDLDVTPIPFGNPDDDDDDDGKRDDGENKDQIIANPKCQACFDPDVTAISLCCFRLVCCADCISCMQGTNCAFCGTILQLKKVHYFVRGENIC
jgi:hypothetical protein